MKIFDSIDQIPYDKRSAITVGTFDGIHVAHQELLKTLVTRARLNKLRSIVLTFDPHPREVLGNAHDGVELLTTMEERKRLCDEFGVDCFVTVGFTLEFAKQSFSEFYKNCIIDTIGVSEVLEGYNHRFGRGREGNVELLKTLGSEFGFLVHLVDPIMVDGVAVSSSLIRESLRSGDIARATMMLGRPYLLKGTVVEGDKRGRTLGFPTANLQLASSKKLIPKNGIYLTSVEVQEQKYFGLTSIGVRPTFYSSGIRLVETYILDFDKDIYGEPITVELLSRIRDEEKFNSTQELIEQMNKDKQAGKELVKNFEKEISVRNL